MCTIRQSMVAALSAISISVPLSGFAQKPPSFPSKAVRLVVPASAGGAPDILARMIGPKLSEKWGHPVIIENRPGAAGTLGSALVSKATPDGHTLLLTSSAFAIGAALQPTLPYDPVKDFAGVANIGSSTMVMVVARNQALKTVEDFIAFARDRPGKILMGSAGAGSATHINGERFRLAAGINVRHVGFKGQPEFLIEIASGRIHFGLATLTVALPLIKDGRLHALAVSQRLPSLPEVPAISDALPGWGRDGGVRILAPAGTPRSIREEISKEIGRVLDSHEVKERLSAVGFRVAHSTPDESHKSLRADIEVFSRVAREAGLLAR